MIQSAASVLTGLGFWVFGSTHESQWETKERTYFFYKSRCPWSPDLNLYIVSLLNSQRHLSEKISKATSIYFWYVWKLAAVELKNIHQTSQWPFHLRMFFKSSLSSFPRLKSQRQFCFSESDLRALLLDASFNFPPCLQGTRRTSEESLRHLSAAASSISGIASRVLSFLFSFCQRALSYGSSLVTFPQPSDSLKAGEATQRRTVKRRLTGAGQSSESTNLWNAVNITNVLRLRNACKLSFNGLLGKWEKLENHTSGFEGFRSLPTNCVEFTFQQEG